MADSDDLPPEFQEAFGSFGDLFNDFFGGGRRFPNMRQLLPLSLEEACEGARKEVRVKRSIDCQRCEGIGAPEDGRSVCPACENSPTEPAFTPCGTCNARGFLIEKACIYCEGQGHVPEHDTLKVTVPAGILDGQTLRLRGQGNEVAGERGHLHLVVEVAKEERMVREGDANLFVIVTVNSTLMESGGYASAPVPGGDVSFNVPAGSRNGATVEIPGQGAPRFGAPPTPRPMGEQTPYRSAGDGAGRGMLTVGLVVDGNPIPDGFARRLRGEAEGEGRTSSKVSGQLAPRVIGGVLAIGAALYWFLSAH